MTADSLRQSSVKETLFISGIKSRCAFLDFFSAHKRREDSFTFFRRFCSKREKREIHREISVADIMRNAVQKLAIHLILANDLEFYSVSIGNFAFSSAFFASDRCAHGAGAKEHKRKIAVCEKSCFYGCGKLFYGAQRYLRRKCGFTDSHTCIRRKRVRVDDIKSEAAYCFKSVFARVCDRADIVT